MKINTIKYLNESSVNIKASSNEERFDLNKDGIIDIFDLVLIAKDIK